MKIAAPASLDTSCGNHSDILSLDYLAYDTERVSRMTVILTCPG